MGRKASKVHSKSSHAFMAVPPFCCLLRQDFLRLLRLSLNLQFFCFRLLSIDIIVMCHHVWNLGTHYIVLFIFSLNFIWCVCTWNSMSVGVRWQFVGVSHLFLPCGSSGHQLGGKYLHPLSHLAGPCDCNSQVSFAQLLWWLSPVEWKESRFRNTKWRFCDCLSVELQNWNSSSGWLFLQSPCDIFASLKFHKTIQCLSGGWKHLEDEPQEKLQVSHLDNHE